MKEGKEKARVLYIAQNGLTLYLDCKTRWSSLLKMLLRYLEVESDVEHTLIDFNMRALVPSQDEIENIKSVVAALAIIEAASRQLCARDANLSTADETFEWMIGELIKIDCPYARRLTGKTFMVTQDNILKILSFL